VPIALRIPFYVVLGNHDYDNNGNPPFNWGVARWQKFYAGYVFTGVNDFTGMNDAAIFASMDPDMDSGCPMSADPMHRFPGPDPNNPLLGSWVPSGNWVMGDDKPDPQDPQKVPPGKQTPSRHYSFQRGDAQFVALDTTPMVAESWQDVPGDTKKERDANVNRMGRQTAYVEEQADSFLQTLKNTSANWKIAFGHHPFVSNGDHGAAGRYDRGNSTTCSGILPDTLAQPTQPSSWHCGWRLWQFLSGGAPRAATPPAKPTETIQGLCEAGLDVYFSGHDHLLQVSSAACGRDSDPAKRRTIPFIVSGGWRTAFAL
jgi:hypothetical protein